MDLFMQSSLPDLKEDIENNVFEYMDKFDCPQVFTDELRQTIAEDINDIVARRCTKFTIDYLTHKRNK